MKTVFGLLILIPVLLLAGCKKDAVAVEISKICAADNEKKYIVTSGFLDDRGSIFVRISAADRLDAGSM